MIKEFYISSSSVDWTSAVPSLCDHLLMIEAERTRTIFSYLLHMYKPNFCVCKFAQPNHYAFCLSSPHLG